MTVEITESLFAHINNDPFLTGSYELEGQNLQNTVGFLAQFLKEQQQFSSQKIPAEVEDLFNACNTLVEQQIAINELNPHASSVEDTKELAENWFHLIQDTNSAKRNYVLLPGGWSHNNGGHLMIYQFHRDINGDIIFTIHNSGSGIIYHARRSEADKELYSPTLQYRIPKDDAAKAKNFVPIIQALIAARLSKLHDEQSIDQNYLYKKVFEKLNFLNAKIIEPDEQAFQYFTGGQLSGTCSQRSIHQMIKARFKSVDDYRQFIFKFKVYALKQYMQKLERENLLGDSQYHPQIKKAIRHLLRLVNVKKVDSVEPLFPDAYRSEHHHQFLTYLSLLNESPSKDLSPSPKAELLDEDTFVIDFTKSKIQDYTFVSTFQHSSLTNPSPMQLDPSKLISDMNSLVNTCRDLGESDNYDAIFEKLENFFLQLPLPDSDSSDLLAFYHQAKISENPQTFFSLMDELQTCYFTAANKLFGNTIVLPRMVTIKASNFAVCEHICKHSDYQLSNLFGSLINGLLISLNQHNGRAVQLSNHNAELDKRLQHVRQLYPGSTATQSRAFPFSYHDKMITHYNQLIGLYPDLKSELEKKFNDKYAADESAMIQQITDKECKALFYFLTYKDSDPDLTSNGKFKNIHELFEKQQALEFLFAKGLTGLWSKSDVKRRFEIQYDKHSDTLKLKSTIQDYGVHFFISSNLEKSIYALNDGPVKNCLSYYVNQGCSLNAARIGPTNSKQVQLKQLPTQHIVDGEVRQEDFEERELYHLRHSPDSQIALTLDYFLKHPDKLRRQDMQIYCEANLFEGDLLYKALTNQPTEKFWELVEKFVEHGVGYSQKQGLHTKHSLFYIRILESIHSYSLEIAPKENKERMKRLIQQLNLWIKAPQHQEEKAALHLYRFKCLNELFQVDGILNEEDYINIFESYFISNSHPLPEAYLEPDASYRLKRCQRAFMFGIEKNPGLIPWNAILYKLCDHKLLPKPSNWQNEPSVNYPNTHFTDIHGHKYNINFQQGIILRDGLALVHTPENILHHPIINHLKLNDVKQCFQTANQKQFIIEKGDIKLRFTREKGSFFVEQLFHSETGIPTWYELVTKDASKKEYLNLPSNSTIYGALPKLLTQRETFLWKNSETNKQLIVTDNHNQVIYKAAKTSQYGWRLRRAKDDALIYLTAPETGKLFSSIESPDFMLISKDKSGCIECELPRYNLHFHKEAVSTRYQWQWDNNDYFLDDVQSLQKHGLPALTFDNQQLCVLPITRFLSGDKRQGDGEYYLFKPDLDNTVATDIVESSPKGDEIPYKAPLVWQYNNSMKAMVLKMKGGEPNPETPAQALYLCYLYLVTHQEERALKMLDLCDRHLGGLEGNYEELQYIQWICEALPYCPNQDINAEKAKISTPPVVACQLKAIQMWTKLDESSRKVTFPNTQAIPSNPDEYYHRKTILSLKTFLESGLNKQIYKLYSRYQLMRRDIKIDFLLTDSESRCLLNYYHDQLPESLGNEPKAIGALGYEWQRLNIINLKQELDRLEQHAKRRVLSDYENSRKREIQTWLNTHEGVYRKQSKLVKSSIDLDISSHKGLKSCPLASESFLNIFPAKIDSRKLDDIQDKLDNVMSLLNPSIDHVEFERNFAYYLAVALKSNQQTNELEAFCKAYLRASRHTKIDKQPNNIPYLCNVLYRVISYKKSNSFEHQNFSTLQDFYQKVRQINPDPIHIYQLEDNSDELLMSIDGIKDRIPDVTIGMQPKVKKTQQSRLDSLQLFPEKTSITSKSFASSWRELETRLYHLKESEFDSDSNDDLETENQAGLYKIKILSELQTKARHFFNQKERITEVTIQSESRLKNLQGEQAKLEQVMTQFANSGPNRSDLKVDWDIDISAQKRNQININQLLSLYIKEDMHLYRHATGLSDENIHILHGQIAEFIKRGLFIQQLERILSETKALEARDYESITDEQLFKLGKVLFATNLSDVLNEPTISVFQYYEGILLRPHQKIGIQKLLQQYPSGRFKEIVAKIVMGGGKSKVFSPILAYSKAKGDNLVLLEVPKALLRTNFTDLKAMSNKLFGQTAELFEFSRDSNCSPKALKAIFRLFTDAMVNKKYLVTTRESIQSLELKYLELLGTKPSNQKGSDFTAWEEQVKWIEKLVLFLKNRGDCIIDEVHEGLLLKDRLNYTIGTSKAVPKFISNEVVALYQFFQHVHLNDIDGVTGSDLTMASLLATYKPLKNKKQYEQACQVLGEQLFTHKQSPLLAALRQNNIYFSETEFLQLKAYFFDRCETIPNCILALPEDLQDIIALYKEQVGHLLPFTLKRNANEHYGPSKNPNKSIEQKAISIPYRANNSPNEHSNFGNEIESINYTIQSLMINGLSEGLLKNYLQYLLQQAKVDNEEKKDKSIDDTATGHLYKAMTNGQSLAMLDLENQEHMAQLYESMAHNESLIFEVLKTQILPNIRINHNVLSSNAINHVDMLRSVQGYSGTPYNASTFHERLKYDQELAVGTDSYIVEGLISKGTAVNTIDFSQPDKLVDNILGRYQADEIVRGIIDISAAFKGIPNDVVARKISNFIALHPEQFNQPDPVKYILFFNDKDQLCAIPIVKEGNPCKTITIGSSNPEVIEEKLGCSAYARFTYYDQAHTLGTDILQGEKAKAISLVDEETTISKFTQGEMRFREILDGQQTTDIYVPLEMDDMSQNLAELCQHMQIKEKSQLRQDNYTAARSKIANFVRNDLLNRILNHTGSASDKAELFEKFSASFIEKQANRLFYRFGGIAHQEKTRLLLDKYRRSQLENWSNMLEKATIPIQGKKLQSLHSKMSNVINEACLPGVCDENQPSSNRTDAIEVELYTEVEKREERIIEKYDPSRKARQHIHWNSPYESFFTEPLALSKILQPVSQKSTPNFDINILATQNFYRLYDDQRHFLSQTMLPVHGILFEQRKDGLECFLLSPEELEDAKNYINNSKNTVSWISTTNHTVLYGDMPSEIKQDPQYQTMIEQIRFFAGDLNLLVNRETPLTWLSEDTAKKLDFFETYLAPARESKLDQLQQLRMGVMTLDKMMKFVASQPERDLRTFNWKARFPTAEESEINEVIRVANAFYELTGSWWHLSLKPQQLVDKYNLSPIALGYLIQYEKSMEEKREYFHKLKRLILTLRYSKYSVALSDETVNTLVERTINGTPSEASLFIEQIDDNELFPKHVGNIELFQKCLGTDKLNYVSQDPKQILPSYLVKCNRLNESHIHTLMKQVEHQPYISRDMLYNRNLWQEGSFANILRAFLKLPIDQLLNIIRDESILPNAIGGLLLLLNKKQSEDVIKTICLEFDSVSQFELLDILLKDRMIFTNHLEQIFKYSTDDRILLSICAQPEFSLFEYDIIRQKIQSKSTSQHVINEIAKYDWIDNQSLYIVDMLTSSHLTKEIYDKLLPQCYDVELLIAAMSYQNVQYMDVDNLTSLLTTIHAKKLPYYINIILQSFRNEHLRPVLSNYLKIFKPNSSVLASIYRMADAVNEQEAAILKSFSFEFARTSDLEVLLEKANHSGLLSHLILCTPFRKISKEALLNICRNKRLSADDIFNILKHPNFDNDIFIALCQYQELSQSHITRIHYIESTSPILTAESYKALISQPNLHPIDIQMIFNNCIDRYADVCLLLIDKVKLDAFSLNLLFMDPAVDNLLIGLLKSGSAQKPIMTALETLLQDSALKPSYIDRFSRYPKLNDACLMKLIFHPMTEQHTLYSLIQSEQDEEQIFKFINIIGSLRNSSLLLRSLLVNPNLNSNHLINLIKIFSLEDIDIGTILSLPQCDNNVMDALLSQIKYLGNFIAICQRPDIDNRLIQRGIRVVATVPSQLRELINCLTQSKQINASFYIQSFMPEQLNDDQLTILYTLPGLESINLDEYSYLLSHANNKYNLGLISLPQFEKYYSLYPAKAGNIIYNLINKVNSESEIVSILTSTQNIRLPLDIYKAIVLHKHTSNDIYALLERKDLSHVEPIRNHLMLYRKYLQLKAALASLEKYALDTLIPISASVNSKIAALSLHRDLSQAAENLVDRGRGLIDSIRLRQFHYECQLAFSNKQRIDDLKENPIGWYGINPFLRKILGIIFGVLIIPAAVVQVASRSGFPFVFFNTPLSEGARKLEIVEEKIENFSTYSISFNS